MYFPDGRTVVSGIAFDASGGSGEVFISDEINHRIVVLGNQGRWLCTFGSHGRRSGQFRGPCAIVACGNGLLFVADQGNHRVQVVWRDGRFVRHLAARVPFRQLRGLCLTRQGDLVVYEHGVEQIPFEGSEDAYYDHLEEHPAAVFAKEIHRIQVSLWQ